MEVFVCPNEGVLANKFPPNPLDGGLNAFWPKVDVVCPKDDIGCPKGELEGGIEGVDD
jgi:hypothetical protein